jgi:hypothetical protein
MVPFGTRLWRFLVGVDSISSESGYGGGRQCAAMGLPNDARMLGTSRWKTALGLWKTGAVGERIPPGFSVAKKWQTAFFGVWKSAWRPQRIRDFETDTVSGAIPSGSFAANR